MNNNFVLKIKLNQKAWKIWLVTESLSQNAPGDNVHLRTQNIHEKTISINKSQQLMAQSEINDVKHFIWCILLLI